MKSLKIILSLSGILFVASTALAYTNLTPAHVHERLVAGDTLVLLDVREISEYTSGHIAEPPGQLPVTPVNMPLNSQVLAAEHERLPRDVDIIVYCRSGGRSASASSLLEGNGFERIYNMTGGFSSWTYESRSGGYGDHSGKWISPTDSEPDTIIYQGNDTDSRIIFPTSALPGSDSLYVELHSAYNTFPNPPSIPFLEAGGLPRFRILYGLFYVTVMDPFGMSVMQGDSLALADTVQLQFAPGSTGNLGELSQLIMMAYNPAMGWQKVESAVPAVVFLRNISVLRRWYAFVLYNDTSVRNAASVSWPEYVHVFPNPFNGSVTILAPAGASVTIYDIRGRMIDRVHGNRWSPAASVVSGIYLVRIIDQDRQSMRRILYLK
ncbi:T9SS type A sorting domain-containing protein [candidate division KSB1 bacterium]|nr:T9SS type A sorting domain-containing protein [candidate division KSB1 bacterium]